MLKKCKSLPTKALGLLVFNDDMVHFSIIDCHDFANAKSRNDEAERTLLFIVDRFA